MTKRTKTDSLNFRISDVRKAKLISIAEHRKKTLTEVIEDWIDKDSEGLPINLQQKLPI